MGHVSPPVVSVKYVRKDATVLTYRVQQRKRGHRVSLTVIQIVMRVSPVLSTEKGDKTVGFYSSS